MLILCLMAFLLASSAAGEEANGVEVSDDAKSSTVDIRNLLLDYNADEGPNKTMTVTLSIYISHASWSNQKLKATFYFRQKWRDHRLTFAGDKDIEIPRRYEIWEPDTFLSSSIKTSASGDRFCRLAPNGTVHKSVQMTATFPCPTTAAHLLANDGVVDCEIDIESYSFSGVALIRYEWKDQDAVKYNDKMSIKAINHSTAEIKLSTDLYPRATVSVKVQTALTTQVLEYIALTKFDL